MWHLTPQRALVIARRALAAVFLVRTTPLVNALPIPLAHVRGPLFGWPEPGWAFAWGDAVAPPWVNAGAALARTLAATAVLFGVWPRRAGAVAGACGLFALSQDPCAFIFTLYTLFLGTLVLALARPNARGLRLVKVFVASIYGWSAAAKLNAEWLSGGTLATLAEDGLVAPRILFEHAWACKLAAWGVMGVEALLPIGLLARRTRVATLAVAFAFHVVLEVGARPDVMGAVMASLLLVFLGDARPRVARTVESAEPAIART